MSQPVLIGFADALAAIESAWCLAGDGFEVHAFARRGSRPPLRRCRGVQLTEVTAPELDAARCAAEVAAAAARLGAVAVLPLDDHAVWACDRASELDGALTVAGPTGTKASLALDKRLQLKAAESAGFAVPPTSDPLSPLPDPGPALTAGGGPGRWMVKPALAVAEHRGRLHRGPGRIAIGPGEVARAGAEADGPVLVQPVLAGTGEGVFGLAIGGATTALSAHRRIRMMNPRGSGSSACRSVPVPADLAGPVRELIRLAGWDGLFMVEVLRDAAGTPWFMELNGRAWGSMALAMHRGYRYPAWAVRAVADAGFRPPQPAGNPHCTARHLGREIVHLAAVLAGGGAPRAATARAVLTVRRSDRWYNYRPGEARVLAADTWATVRGQVAPRLAALARSGPASGNGR